MKNIYTDIPVIEKGDMHGYIYIYINIYICNKFNIVVDVQIVMPLTFELRSISHNERIYVNISTIDIAVSMK